MIQHSINKLIQIKKKMSIERMDTDAGTSGSPSAKRARIQTRNTDIKSKVFSLAYHFWEEGINDLFANKHLDTKEIGKLDLKIGDALAEILYNEHHFQRASKNRHSKSTLAYTQAAKENYIPVRGTTVTVSHDKSMAWLMAAAKKAGIDYDTMTSKHDFFGVASPIIAFFRLYKLRQKELHMGHLTYTPAEGTVGTPVSTFGFKAEHNVLLEGITFPPAVQSSVAGVLGPGVILLKIFENCQKMDKRYLEKWLRVMNDKIGHLRHGKDIVAALRVGVPIQVRKLFTQIVCDYLLVTYRMGSRMTPNLSQWCTAYSTFRPEDRAKIGFSGNVAHVVWRKIGQFQFVGYIVGAQKEINFHSTWGTYKEDLGVLGAITNHSEWKTRSEIGKDFSADDKGTSFSPIRFKIYLKTTTATPSSQFANQTRMLTALPVFSGMRKRACMDALITKEDRSLNIGMGVNNLHELLRSMMKTRNDYLVDNRGKTTDLGIQSWRQIEDLTFDRDGREYCGAVTKTGRYWIN